MGIRNRWWLGALVLGAAVGAYAWVQSTDGGTSARIAAQVVTQSQVGVMPSSTVVTAQAFGTWPAEARLRFTNWQSPTTDLTAGAADVVAVGGELYALGEFGGIYRSADAGSSWTMVGAVRNERRADPIPYSRLAVLPADGVQPAVYFAMRGASSDTSGTMPALYRVSEGHTDIVSVLDPASPWQAWGYKMHVQGASVLLAFGDGIARSDDRGRTWQLLLDSNGPCTDVVSAGRYVYAACGSLYRSVDGGLFEPLPAQAFSLAVAPSDPTVVYANAGLTLYRSRDAGVTWTQTFDVVSHDGPMYSAMWGQELEVVCGQDTGSPAATKQSIVVDPQNPDVVWWGYGQLYRSDDGAVTFGRASIRPGSGPSEHALSMGIQGLAFAPTAGGAPHRLMVATSSGVVSTDNANAAVQSAETTTCANLDQYPAVTYARRSQGMSDVLFRDVAVAGDDGVLITTARDRGFLMSWLDEPATWSTMPFSNNVASPTSLFVNPYGTLDRFFTNICPGYASCRWDLDATTGAWIPSEPTIFYAWGFAYDPQQPNRVWTSLSRRVRRSDDGLQTEANVGRGVDCTGPQMIAVSPNDSNLVVIAGRCGIGRRTDALTAPADANWSVQRLRAEDWTVNALEFDPLKPNNVYLATSGEPSIYASTNSGATWAAIDAPGDQDGLPTGDAHSLAIDPESSDILYLGTSEGLYVSWDTGAATRTWHEVPTPFRGMSIEKVVVRRTGEGTRRAYVFTHGVGVWIADVQLAAFTDVGIGRWSDDYVTRLYAAGITTGCGMQRYCPTDAVLREQMAVFLLRAAHGGTYAPPVATGMFADVDSASPYRPWIEQLAREGVTSGCGAGFYCPGEQVSRGQMAVFLLRAKHGSTYQPPQATGRFEDVAVDSPMGPWIEQLAQEGITGGCSATPARYCPDDAVTREQMAVFLVKTFGL